MKQTALKVGICRIAIILLVPLGAGTGALAQSWHAGLTIDPYPSPYLTHWQTDPTLATLEIQNLSNKADVVIADLTISENGGGPGFQGNSRRVLVNPGETIWLNNTGLTDWYTGTINETYRLQAVRTGMLPEGDYEVHITLRDQWGTVLVEDVYGFFTIVHPEAPELIYPVGDDPVYETHPVLQWIPPTVPSDLPVLYSLRVVELLDGQNPSMAIDANYPQAEYDAISGSTFEYPFDALPLQEGKSYVWRIRALDLEGRPLTKNNGFSDIGTFTRVDPLQQVLTLNEPENGATITDPAPEFSWNPLSNPTGAPLYYHLKIAEIPPSSRLLPEEAMRYGWPLWQTQTTETVIRYPFSAQPLLPGHDYAWQVQAVDGLGNPAAVNNGFSEAFSFSADVSGLDGEDEAPELPEILALPDQSIAYLQLKRGGKPLMEYTLSADGRRITLNFNSSHDAVLFMTAFTAFHTGIAPAVEDFKGTLVFEKESLRLISGTITANPVSIPLASVGLPFEVTRLSFSPARNFQCAISLVLFGQTLSSLTNPLTATLDGAGTFLAAVPSQRLDRGIPLVENSDKLSLFIRTVHADGNQIRAALPGVPEPQLILDAEIRGAVMGTGASAGAVRARITTDADGRIVQTGPEIMEMGVSTPVTLKTDGKEIDIVNAAEPLSFKLTPPDRQINVNNLLLTRLDYYEGFSQPWSFQFRCDVKIRLSGVVTLPLPLIPDVLMTEKGVEIPFVDMAVQGEWMEVNGVRVRPYAYRQPAYTYDWYHEPAATVWPDRFDVEIDLNLPERLASLDMPYTANDVQWSDSAFTGAWNERNFLEARFAPFGEDRNGGLQVRSLAGFFEDGGTRIQVQADLEPPSGMSLPSRSLALQDALTMDAEGCFIGQSAMTAWTDPLPWGPSGLSLDMTKNVTLELGRNDRTQTAGLRFEGKIILPPYGGTAVTATGRGVLDMLDGTLESGTFLFSDAYTLCLPASRPVFRFDMLHGGTIDGAGLHFTAGESVFIPSDDARSSCTFSRDLTLTLPGWQPAGGDGEFSESFALELSNFYGDAGGYRWRALSRNFPDQATDADRLRFMLPENARIDNGRILADGQTPSALFVFRGRLYESSARFSADFAFEMSPSRVSAGRIDFVIENETIATLDPEGLHLGAYFGAELAAERILLPNAETAFIDLDERALLKLVLEKEGEWVSISTMEGETVTLVLPAFSYGGEAPSVHIVLNGLLVDPRTGLAHASSDVTFSLGDNVDLSGKGIMLAIPSLTFTPQNRLEAEVRPLLPMALRTAGLGVRKVAVGSSGLASINDNYSSFSASGSPRDSVNHGPTLRTSLDGMFFNQENQVLKVSGDFRSPLFGAGSVHFIMTLDPRGAVFDAPAGADVTVQTGSAALTFNLRNNRLFQVSAPLNRDEILLEFGASLAFSNGLALTLQRVGIDGQHITIDPGADPQQARLFGADLTVTDIVPEVLAGGALSLGLDGTMTLFGREYPFTGLELDTRGALTDKVLYTQSGSGQGGTLAVTKLEIQNGRLKTTGNVALPDPFDAGASKAFVLLIDPRGDWYKNGVRVTESVLVQSETAGHAEANLGTDEEGAIRVPMRLARLALEKEGEDNSVFAGRIRLSANTWWPNPVEARLWQVDAAITLTDQGDQVEWSIPAMQTGGTQTNPETIPVNNVAFNNIYDLSVDGGDSLFTVMFTNSAGLPDNAIIVGGELEFKENILRRDYFEQGRFTACEFDLLVFRVSISNIEFFQGKAGETRDVEISDITFKKDVTEVKPKTIKASTYFRVTKAVLDGEFMYASGGIDEFRWIDGVDPADGKERQILFMKNARINIPDKFGARIDLLADIKDADEFRFLIGGSAHFECMGESSTGAVLVGVAEMKDNLPGFGAFISMNWKDYYPFPPVPISVAGLGGGIFVNVNSEVDEIIRAHLGLDTNSLDPEFSEMLDKMRDEDPRTFGKIMLYGQFNIPSSEGIKLKGLMTLATDRIRIDLKVTGITNESLKDYLSFYGLGFVEAAWRPNFSGFDYLAGNINIAASPEAAGYKSLTGGTKVTVSGTELHDTYAAKSLVCLPDVGTFKIKFVIAPEAWAVHGLISSKTPFFYNEMEAEAALSNYGFFVRGKYAVGFDILIIKVEAGLELAVYVFNPPGTTTAQWGGYGNAYVEAELLGGWLASARGDLYIGMFAENTSDFYLFGAATLRATVLGISKEMGLWAKWESDGGFDAGTGIDEEMMERIADCQDKANQIVAAATGIGGLNLSIGDVEIAQLQQEVETMVAEGRDGDYIEGVIGTIELVRREVPESKRQEITSIFVVEDVIGDFVGTDFSRFRSFSKSWFQDLQYAAEGSWESIAEELNATSMDQQLSSIDMSLEEIAAAARGVSIQKAYTETSESVGGMTIPVAEVDPSLSEENRQNVETFQNSYQIASTALWKRIKAIKAGREAIYADLSYENQGSVGKQMEQAIGTIDITRMMGESQTQSEALIRNLEYVSQAHGYLTDLVTVLGRSSSYLSLEQIRTAVNREWRELSNDQRREIYTLRMNGLGRSFDYESGSFSEEEYKRLAVQTYYYVPILLTQAYNLEIAKMYNSIASAWQNGQAAFDEAAAGLTRKTDGLWDKYLDLSENYHRILSDFREIYTDAHISRAASDSAETFLEDIRNEFIFPDISVTASVLEPQESSYFRELSLNISTSPSELKLAETQISIDDVTFSMGGLQQISRYAFLYPRVFYKDPSLVNHVLIRANDSMTPVIGFKLRNQAGRLAPWPRTYTANLSYYRKSVFYPNRNTFTESTTTGTTTQVPLRFPGCYHDAGQDQYVTGLTDTLDIAWEWDTSAGAPAASYTIEIRPPRGSVRTRDVIWSDSESGSVSNTNILLCRSTVPDVGLNSSGRYTLTLKGRDLDGSLVMSGQKALYVNTSVPSITGEPALGFLPSHSCLLLLPSVSVPLPYGGSKTVGGLEVKIVESGQAADSVAWAKAGDFRYIPGTTGLPQRIYIGSLPYRKSFTACFRAPNPLWQSGYASVTSFSFRRIPETEPPQKAIFDFVSIDASGNTTLRVLQEPADTLSGLKDLFYHVARAQSPGAVSWTSSNVFYPLSDAPLQTDDLVTLPTDRMRQNLFGSLVYTFITRDMDGNQISSTVTTKTVPRPPQEMQFYLDDRYLVCEGQFDQQMVQDAVEAVRITMMNGSDSLVVSKAFRDGSGSFWHQTGAVQAFQARWDAGTLLSDGETVQIVYQARNYNPYQKRTQFSEIRRSQVGGYAPMFTTVSTSEAGRLVIPFVAEGFNGARQADYYVALGGAERSAAGSLRPFPEAPDFRSVQVSAGAELEIPFNANDCDPRTTVTVKAVAADGAIHITRQQAAIVPVTPWLTTAPTIEKEGGQYVLSLTPEQLPRIFRQQSEAVNGNLRCSLHETIEGEALGTWMVRMWPWMAPEDRRRDITSLAQGRETLYLIVKGVTAAGTEARDSSVYRISVPQQ
ncbi:hypothetical protein JXO52_05260 [bacterium]|nr:hypothetical protein [bacterium]